eukprot:gnl/Hemi2/26762_TR9000_c0_g1_i1.p1 gnl/Hemi2/26762_TR9000_c0_g1~~gnl/Hemi2/26762_TR9000_c0_g1_i1.p1  ORF type:complete len:237 (+),score=51.60 gnl/Hemi2/26762_TR9000_c0_g1_i1:88-798(+)
MTFFHLVNCLLLTFFPSFIFYKCTPLSENGSLGVTLWGGLTYLLTQLAKMIILATFLPSTEAGVFYTSHELFKWFVGLGDVYGLYLLLSSSNYNDFRMLGVGLGWATADSLCLRFVLFVVGARALEFDWKYIQESIEANINIVHYLALTVLVWLYTRKKLDRKMLPLIVGGIFLASLLPLVNSVVRVILALDGWAVLGVHSCISSVLAMIALSAYRAFQQSIAQQQQQPQQQQQQQ